MNPLYNAGIALYSTAARLAAIRSDKVARMLSGQKRALDTLADVRRAKCLRGFDFWFHAASLGEFEQARPLIEAIRREKPDTTICLSFFSPSGYDVRKNYPLVDAVVYLPFDTPRKARRFVEAINPRTAVFVKYEFWGNLLSELHRRDVPTYLVSAIFRPTQSFFRPWGQQFRNILRNFTHIFVQDENSKQLLQTIGITDTTVAGDTRFDRVADIRTKATHLPAIEKWLKDSPFTLIAGSSWPQDEQRYIPWVNAHPQARLILAPHEFDERRLADLEKQFTAPVAFWSRLEEGDAIPVDTRILIIDTFGLLSILYRYGHVAIIGGGFGDGIHNINEAAVYGIPVIFGPNNRKFREAADLISLKAGFQYDNANPVATTLDRMALIPGTDTLSPHVPCRIEAGKKAAQYIEQNRGATKIILEHLLD